MSHYRRPTPDDEHREVMSLARGLLIGAVLAVAFWACLIALAAVAA